MLSSQRLWLLCVVLACAVLALTVALACVCLLPQRSCDSCDPTESRDTRATNSAANVGFSQSPNWRATAPHTTRQVEAQSSLAQRQDGVTWLAATEGGAKAPPVKPTLVLLQACFNVDLVDRCLTTLYQNQLDLKVIVVENPSPRSAEMERVVHSFVKLGLVVKHLRMAQNQWGAPFVSPVLLGHLSEWLDKCPYLCLTDGDVEMHDRGWLSECQWLLQAEPALMLAAVDFDERNLPRWHPQAEQWVPTPARVTGEHGTAYQQRQTGVQMLCFRTAEYVSLCEELRSLRRNFADTVIYDLVRARGRQCASTTFNLSYHVGWDVYTSLHLHGSESVYAPYEQFKADMLRAVGSVTDQPAPEPPIPCVVVNH